MKIIVSSPVWSLNGVNTFAASLVRGLGDSGIAGRLLLTGVTYRERKPMPLPRDIPVEHLHLPAVATWSRRMRALIGYLESHAPCIYLPNHDFPHSCVSPALSSRVGVVGIVHSDDAQHYDHAARLGRTWNAAVAVSEKIAERCVQMGAVDASRLSCIPYGVPVAPEPARRTISDEVRLIYSGRLDKTQKRVGDLILLAAELSRREIGFRLTIVGDGPERGTLERGISDHRLENRVTLLGTLGNEDVVAMCAQHDAFILPSAYEGMPIGMLEAMGQGCVPFASEVESGVPEILRHGYNGFTFRTGDVASLAGQVAIFAMSAEMRGRMSRAAWRTIAEGDHRTETMVARYAKLFEHVWMEVEEGSFRGRSGRVAPAELSLRDRVAAPLWFVRPSIRAQQSVAQ